MSAAVATAGLLLAAGAGSRFGRPKALVAFGGELLVERGLRVLRAAGCDPVLVVLGAARDEVLARAALGDAVVVDNPDFADGLGSSLRVGLEALVATDAAAVVVTLADQPLVGPPAVARVAAAAGSPAAAASYGGRQRNPVRLAREVWAEVAAGATGDAGARGWLRAHPALVTDVPCDDVGDPVDIDTPADLDALCARPARSTRPAPPDRRPAPPDPPAVPARL